MCISVCACSTPYTQPDAPIKEVPFTQVHLDDNFWTPRIETNRTVSIPSAFKECEKNGRFDNFAIAGGLMKGEHRGDFSFDDTDPYKIIEGASYSLAVKYDEKLDHYLDSVIHIIAAAQEPDGYLTTCVTNQCTRLSGWWGTHRWEKINSHELYNSGHLYEAAVAHYRATGKRTLLDVAIKNADLVCQVFGSLRKDISIAYFSTYPGIRTCLRMAERSIGMERIKKPKIKSIPYEEFTDNETLEKLVRELNAGGANVALGRTGRFHQLGTQQFAVAAYVCNKLLRYRVHGTGCRAVVLTCPVFRCPKKH